MMGTGGSKERTNAMKYDLIIAIIVIQVCP